MLGLAGCSRDASPPGLSASRPGLNVARAALDGGAANVALNVASGIITEKPGDADAFVVQGDAYAALDRRPEAEAAYRHALALAPQSADARMGLGRLALATSPAVAEALFLDVLGRDPNNAKALNDIGIARDLQGRHADAQTAYRQALGLAPEMQAAVVNLALSLALSGRAAEGASLLRPLASSPRIRHDLAAISAMGGDRGTAATLLAPDVTGPQLQETLRFYGDLAPSKSE